MQNLLERCRSIDFSAESKNREENLAALKSKIGNGEFCHDGKTIPGGEREMKKFKKPVALIAAAIAVLALSVGALAAAPLWRQLETRIIEGGEFVNHFSMYVLEGGDTPIIVTTGDIEPGGRVVVEIEGEQIEVSENPDDLIFYDLDEALSHFAAPNVLRPAYLPAFPVRFEFNSAHIRAALNPGDVPHNIILVYSTGTARNIIMHIDYIPEGLEMPENEMSFEETADFDGRTVTFSGLSRHIDRVVYTITSTDVDYATLEGIADSLQ